MPEPWEDSEGVPIEPDGEDAVDWERALAWFEREILPDFVSQGYTKGEALNAWMQQRIMVQLGEVMTAIEELQPFEGEDDD
jgi:hypothetical protein